MVISEQFSLSLIPVFQQQLYNFLMDRLISAQCPKGHPASQLCSLENCTKSAIMCDNIQCDCKKYHPYCKMITQFNLIALGLRVKINSYSPVLDYIYTWCEKMIKHFKSLMDQLQTSADSGEYALEGDERVVCKLLSNKKYQDIKPDLIYRAGKSLSNQPKIEIDAKIKDSEKALKEAESQITSILQNIRIFTQKNKDSTVFKQSPKKIKIIQKKSLGSSKNFVFSESLHHISLKVQKNTVVLQEKSGDNYRLALLEPTIFENPTKEDISKEDIKIRLQVTKTSQKNIFFGVCRMGSDTGKKFQVLDSISEFGKDKIVICGQNGKLYSDIVKSKNKQQSSIKSVEAGQILKIIYSPSASMLTFHNQTKGLSEYVIVQFKGSSPVYFCVMLKDKNDTVKLI